MIIKRLKGNQDLLYVPILIVTLTELNKIAEQETRKLFIMEFS